ncbi:MAG: tRNA glutamyl-Q(34) synthetase GluQRS [Desulfobacteraceae bacterium 4572_35.1]|nr:MAG: tRNA glutamyl-Q(34) synthetase GluQRS [Desulfobacteraceae bacterium 4572_35.1]
MSSHRLIKQQVGRFAPSPTGILHFGSLVTAVASFCHAKQSGGKWLVRIDDLDQPRVVVGAADIILHQLDSLGLHWDSNIIYQSKRYSRYEEIIDWLNDQNLIYPCICSRKHIVASAPHFGDDGPIYPGTCLRITPNGQEPAAMRIKTGQRNRITFSDLIQGEIKQDIANEIGDFILRRRDGVFAYQLAVVIDDYDSGVTQVVRGRDLLSSTTRQIFLSQQLKFTTPTYAHLPLALNCTGEKISKRHHQIDANIYSNGSKLIFKTLQFLGQNPPSGLRGESPQQLLRWACDNFSLSSVPKVDSYVPLERH